MRGHHWPEVFGERHRFVGKAGEQDSAEVLHAQLAQGMVFAAELLRHPALAGNAARKRHPDERAGRVVAPLVIDADMVLRIAAQLAPDDGTAMRAQVDERVHRSFRIAVIDHRIRPEPGGAEIPRIRDLGIQPEVHPNRAFENAPLLEFVQIGVVIHRIRDARIVVARPADALRFAHAISCSMRNMNEPDSQRKAFAASFIVCKPRCAQKQLPPPSRASHTTEPA